MNNYYLWLMVARIEEHLVATETHAPAVVRSQTLLEELLALLSLSLPLDEADVVSVFPVLLRILVVSDKVHTVLFFATIIDVHCPSLLSATHVLSAQTLCPAAHFVEYIDKIFVVLRDRV